MPHPREEIETVMLRYVEMRTAIDDGTRVWTDLLEFYTDDAIYIDPAWGRVEGIDAIREFMVESMLGLEDWRFPVEFTAVSGDDVAVKWLQILPGTRPDGRPWVQSGWSRLVYAGDGRFRYQEDMLNMSHVIEDMRASGWRPGPGFSAPPAEPDRDISIPER
ncbi:MAG: nuclear transport factor 2 family protein [Actinomycetes bacterium]